MLKISVWGLSQSEPSEMSQVSTDRHTASTDQHSHSPLHTLDTGGSHLFHKLPDVHPLTDENLLEDWFNPQSWACVRKYPQRFLRAELHCLIHSPAWSQQCSRTKIFGIGYWMEGKNFSCEDYNFICKKHRVHTSLFPLHLQFHPRIIAMLVTFV